MNKVIKVLFGCLVTCIGILILRHSHLVTGGTAGFALSLVYLLGIPFSTAFIIVNIPFYILSIMRMGWQFTLSTIFAVTSVSLMTEFDRWLPNFSVPDWIGAILGGGMTGLGLSFLFWNGSSLGGVNVLVLYLQRKYGWDPGKGTFILDCAVVMTGVYAVGVSKGLYSVLSVVVVSSIISFFKGRIANKNVSVKTDEARLVE